MDLASQIVARPGDRRPWVTASLLSISSSTRRATVSIDGSPALSLPYCGSDTDYSGAAQVFVLRDPTGSGAGQLVLGPAGTSAGPGPAPPPPDTSPSSTTTASTVRSTAMIRPSWSGTWRETRSAYDRWNVGEYGGRSALWQGSAYGSGPLYGVAVYGTQVKDLGALTIERIEVLTPFAYGSGTVVVKGTSSGTKPAGAPTYGTTSAADSDGRITLPSDMREAFRTGSMRGLVLVGSTYLSVYGTARSSGMALSITYTRPA